MGISIGTLTKAGTVTPTQKMWKSLQALGAIAFAYSFSIILIEIENTLHLRSGLSLHPRVVLSTISVWSFLPPPCGCSTSVFSFSTTSVWFPLPTIVWVFFIPKTQISYPNLRIHTHQSFPLILPNFLAPNLRIHIHLLFPNLASLIREETFFAPQWVWLEVSVQRSFAFRGA